MTLVLIDSHGARTPSFSALGGTTLITNAAPGHPSSPAEQAIPPDRLDLAFSPDILFSAAFLNWMAQGGDQAEAQLSVQGGKSKTVYLLSTLSTRSVTVTQSQDGAGQASLVLVAQHVKVGDITVN